MDWYQWLLLIVCFYVLVGLMLWGAIMPDPANRQMSQFAACLLLWPFVLIRWMSLR